MREGNCVMMKDEVFIEGSRQAAQKAIAKL
jgi:hypothetical protein